jgi:hypothetical protein
MLLIVNRAPVLTLWGSVVAERLGHPRDTALTLGRAVGGSTARLKVRIVGQEEWRIPDPDTPPRREEDVRAPVYLLGKTIGLLPSADGKLRAAFRTLPTAGLEVADEFLPANPTEIERYLAKAFGEYLAGVRAAMEALAQRYEPTELNRIGFRLYEEFRPEIPLGYSGGGAKAALEVGKILGAALTRPDTDVPQRTSAVWSAPWRRSNGVAGLNHVASQRRATHRSHS